MLHRHLPFTVLALLLTEAADAGAVSSAELYQTQTYTYGRFEARVRFAAGDGVVSSFFLWKPGSEVPGTVWNELDFEKLGADCRLQTNPLYGLPVVDRGEVEAVEADLCGDYHTYTFEWTPTYLAYEVDGVEVRRDGEEAAAAFAENAAAGMQVHFNIWPEDATFGGNFDPAILPVHQYIAWVQYSSFADGAFTLEWREEFDGPTLPSGWAVGDWLSPKNLSTHQPANVTFTGGVAVLSLTADDATGFGGAPPGDVEGGGAPGSSPDAGGAAGTGAGGVGGGGAPAATAGAGGGGAPAATAGAGDLGSPTGEVESGAAGESAAPSAARPAGSGGGGCVVAAGAPPAGAGWFAVGGAALVAWRRRRPKRRAG